MKLLDIYTQDKPVIFNDTVIELGQVKSIELDEQSWEARLPNKLIKLENKNQW
jgi:hypothetical protein